MGTDLIGVTMNIGSDMPDHRVQQSIRDSREPRYYERRDHPLHSQYRDYQRNQKNVKVQGKARIAL
jgi:hypothetical protein